MFLTQTISFGNNTVLYAMYGGLSLFFLWKVFKTKMAQKNLEGQIFKFSKNISKLMIGLGLLIIVFSILSFFQGQYLTGALMGILIFVLALEYSDPNMFAENGFIIDSKFLEWNNVRKWKCEKEKGELTVQFKEGFDEKTSYMRLKPEDVDKVDQLFRKYKLKK